ncbi:FxLYD domain-containing protein [Loigolactobacillus coryniformis]|uniref:Uncharacterized protein n=1 Tax=Loigolactobacillus coryniformis TaxID=1610 RepID=A0A5B8TE13_9LACO|nr:FxLYD domain-containing protein [Loigolactobacillus coryniformis]QEA52677.1 hypothetical protein FGL77_04720 [Loigolactobacillus coryniformis]
MIRGKKIGVVLLFMGLILFLAGCGNTKKETKYYDDDFITAMEQGLEDRWKLNDKGDEDDPTKADYKSWADAELKQVSSYRNKKFKDAKLQELAISYINSLNGQKATLKYFGSDDFYDKWTEAYDKRTQEIVAINKIHKLKVSDKFQSKLDELLGNGKSVNEKANKDDKVDELLKTIQFTAQPKEYAEDEYTTYTAEAVNNTGFDIKSFSANVKIKDTAGTTVDTQYINTENWANGDKVKFEFTTDQEVASYEVIKSYIKY